LKTLIPLLTLLTGLALAITPVVSSSTERVPVVSVTHHTGEFNGTTVEYTATVRENFLSGPDGIPNAHLVTIAYVREGVSERVHRPVAFVFNGGPGASSSPLHMNGIGPRVRDGDAVRNNPYSLLDVADLVFIDPVGAGFSRNFTTVAGKQYWSRSGDAKSVANVIKRWLKDNQREASPRFLIGESYGTVRNAVLLQNHQAELGIDGVVQVSMVGHGSDDPDARVVGDFPSMAATAWYWEKIPRDRSVTEVFEEAAAFASGELSAALAKGDALPDRRKRSIAAAMSVMIGIPAELTVEKNLRLSKDDFMFTLIADRDLRIGQLDTRVSSPLEGATRGPAGDPTMFGPGGLKIDGSGLIGIDEPNQPPEADRPPSALERYLTGDLEFETAVKRYRGVNFDANQAWDHEGSPPIAPIIAKAMRDDPELRLVWTNGYYDLSTPAYAARQSLQEAGVPSDRVQEILLPGPHSVFQGDENKAILSDALREFLTDVGRK
jgi:carboxypeptidase C (cathepsin A)